MGRKFIVPYGLYRAEGFVSANLARKTTGFDEDDLALLWKAILNMFENDRSAARGMMAVRKLIIFKHDSELGNAPAWKLFKLVDVQRKPEIAAPRSFEDYQFSRRYRASAAGRNLPNHGVIPCPSESRAKVKLSWLSRGLRTPNIGLCAAKKGLVKPRKAVYHGFVV